MPPSQCPPITKNFMDKNIRQGLYVIGLGLFVIGLAAVSLWADFSNRKTESAGAAIRPFGLERVKCQTATSTPKYLTAAVASTSCMIGNMDQIANADLRFMAYSSTTAPTISYAYFVSNENSTTSASLDWYLVGYGTKTFSTSTTMTYPFNSIPLSSLAGNLLKIEWTSSVAADTYLEVIKDPK